LKRSDRKCEQRKLHDPWTVESKTIVPLLKVESTDTTAAVAFQGEKIDLSKSLPASYTGTVAKAKTGEWVGYVFTAKDGGRSAAILTRSVQ
jgi:hypothetical protein